MTLNGQLNRWRAAWPAVLLAAFTALAMAGISRVSRRGGSLPDNGARDKRLAADVRQQATDVAAKWSAVQTRGAELVLPQRAAQQHQETAQQAGAITAAVAAAVAPTPPAAEYAMSGTATYAGLRYAWLNGHLYAEGDSTATGTRLAQVGKDYVVLVDKQGARHVVQSAKK